MSDVPTQWVIDNVPPMTLQKVQACNFFSKAHGWICYDGEQELFPLTDLEEYFRDFGLKIRYGKSRLVREAHNAVNTAKKELKTWAYDLQKEFKCIDKQYAVQEILSLNGVELEDTGIVLYTTPLLKYDLNKRYMYCE